MPYQTAERFEYCWLEGAEIETEEGIVLFFVIILLELFNIVKLV